MVAERTLVVGRITGVYGLHGWVKVFSETEPIESILTYSPWLLGEDAEKYHLVEGRVHGKGLVARLEGCQNRDDASALVGRVISVSREQLPLLGEGEFYWADLEGLQVKNLEGVSLGKIDHLFATAGNDVMVVCGERERLIPFLWEEVIRDVDFDLCQMRVDWDPDF